jgi:hypothetical protein
MWPRWSILPHLNVLSSLLINFPFVMWFSSNLSIYFDVLFSHFILFYFCGNFNTFNSLLFLVLTLFSSFSLALVHELLQTLKMYLPFLYFLRKDDVNSHCFDIIKDNFVCLPIFWWKWFLYQHVILIFWFHVYFLYIDSFTHRNFIGWLLIKSHVWMSTDL